MGGRDITNMGGFQGQFPSTRWSMVLDARENSPEALETLCGLYWKPVYLCLRANSSLANEELKDQVQEFSSRSSRGKSSKTFPGRRGVVSGPISAARSRISRRNSTGKRAPSSGAATRTSSASTPGSTNSRRPPPPPGVPPRKSSTGNGHNRSSNR